MGRKALPAPDGFKKCTACGELRPATTEFWHAARKGFLGFAARCKSCKNAEIARAVTPEQKHRYYIENKPRHLATCEAWRAKNPERVKANIKSWRARNKEYIRRKSKEWEDANRPKVRLIKRASQAKRRSRAECGSHTFEHIEKQLKGQRHCCWWCQKKVTKYHVDHRIPLSRGGSNGPENIVIACPACNLSRHAKLPWQIDNPRLL